MGCDGRDLADCDGARRPVCLPLRCFISKANDNPITKGDASSCRSSYSLYRRSMAVKMAGGVDTDLRTHGVRDMTQGLVTRKRGTNPAWDRTFRLRRFPDGI